jgi:hypothetical protein
MFGVLMMFYVVKCFLMNYMLICCLWNLTLLLENVAICMGNLQVIKIRGGREWTPHIVSRCSDTNGMGLAFISIPYVLFMNFLWTNIGPRLMRFFMMRPACQRLSLCWTNFSAAKFQILWCWIWRLNCYLFGLRILRSETFRLKLLNSDLYLRNF